MRPLNFLYIHITNSYYGNEDIVTGWHTWPKDMGDGTLRHKGKIYQSDDDLPVEFRGKRGNDWPNVAYTYLIGNTYPTWESWAKKRPVPDHDGKIYEMLPHGTVGHHAKGHNDDSLSIVMVAKVDEKTGRGVLTGSQLKKLRRLTKSLIARYPGIEVRGHYETGDPNRTYCPSIDMHYLRSYIFSRNSK